MSKKETIFHVECDCGTGQVSFDVDKVDAGNCPFCNKKFKLKSTKKKIVEYNKDRIISQKEVVI
jgi:hypothetical protein